MAAGGCDTLQPTRNHRRIDQVLVRAVPLLEFLAWHPVYIWPTRPRSIPFLGAVYPCRDGNSLTVLFFFRLIAILYWYTHKVCFQRTAEQMFNVQ